MTTTLDQAGYVFQFNGHGAFGPDGRLDSQPTPEQIAAHNQAIAERELEEMKQTGRATLYSFVDTSGHSIGTWASKPGERFRATSHSYSRNNFGAQRMDVWFTGPDGKQWHGVNIGDNDIVRCKRLKG